MDKERVISNVKNLVGDYTTMEYVFPAFLIFGACVMFFFLLLVIFGNDKVIIICFSVQYEFILPLNLALLLIKLH